MLIRAFARTVALAAVAVSVAACEYSPSTVDRTLAYNNAISQSTNDLFLLNALRAYQRNPTYYTRNQADTTTSTITPSISGSGPLGSTTTLATAAATNSNPIGIPSGFFNTTTVTKTLTQAARSLAGSLTGTEQNQLTLTNLDDQPSMQGLLTPVTLQQVSNYLNEGYSPQELYFLYLQNITLSKDIVDRLPNAIAEYCAYKLGDLAYSPSSYCQYFFGSNADTTMEWCASNPQDRDSIVCKLACQQVAVNPLSCGSVTPIDVNPGLKDRVIHRPAIVTNEPAVGTATTPSEDSAPKWMFTQNAINSKGFDAFCFDGKTISTKPADLTPPAKAKSRNLTYINDPASNRPKDKTAELHSFYCFKQVLTALLALDFRPTDSPQNALYRLPLENATRNPRYLADLSQQGFDVVIGKGNVVGVCKKPDGLSLTFAVDDWIKLLIPELKAASGGNANGEKGSEISVLTRDSGQDTNEPSATDASKNACVTALRKLKDESVGFVEPPPAEPATSTKDSKKRKALTKSEEKKDKDTEDDGAKVSYTPRSLEAMVYFLGEIIREKYPDGDSENADEVTFWNAGDVAHPYEEELFDVKKGSAADGAISVATSEAGTFYVPKLCPDDEKNNPRHPHEFGGCNAEYPNHASAQILTVLNQLWGLNKTQATAPVIAPVTVINPG
jgi:hypothetical protein